MKKSRTALSIVEMQEITKLGIDTSDASMMWCRNLFYFDEYELNVFSESLSQISCLEVIPAYTLEDILLKLPFYTLDSMDGTTHDGYYKCEMETGSECPLDTAYKMFLWAAFTHPERINRINRSNKDLHDDYKKPSEDNSGRAV